MAVGAYTRIARLGFTQTKVCVKSNTLALQVNLLLNSKRKRLNSNLIFKLHFKLPLWCFTPKHIFLFEYYCRSKGGLLFIGEQIAFIFIFVFAYSLDWSGYDGKFKGK
jgi:hypothetical protein